MFQEMNMKPVAEIKKQDHFVFSSVKPGCVLVKTRDDGEESVFAIMNDAEPVDPEQLPDIIPPQGLSAERQWYLYDSVRPLVPEVVQNVICPLPLVERRTFAQARAECMGRPKIGLTKWARSKFQRAGPKKLTVYTTARD